MRVGRPALRRVYYPGVYDELKAKPIDIKGPAEISGIDISMGPAEPTFSVSGKIIDEANGEPVANLSVGLAVYSEGKRIGGRGGADLSGPKGEFKIENIRRVRYSLYARGSLYVSESAMPDHFGNSEQFEVVDQDVTGIILKTARTASVSGFVVLENKPDKSILAKLQDLRFHVTSIPKIQGRMVSSKRFSLWSDETFNVSGLMPGVLNFGLTTTTPNELSPFRILRVELNGNDQPVEINAGANLTGVRLVLVLATASLRGTTKFLNGDKPGTIRGTAGLYDGQTLVGAAVIDHRGRFLLESIPAGSYRLIVSVAISGPKHETSRSEQTIDVSEHQALEIVVWLDRGSKSP